LREIISLLQSERIQYTHPPVHHEDDNNWCQAARGKSKKKSKKVIQYFTTSTNNRFNILNEVTDETEQRKAPNCPKVNGEKKSKLMFYSDSYGRDIPMSLSKINVVVSMFGEIRPGAKVKDVLKNCVRDCTALDPQDHVVIMGGANDISRIETKNGINTLKSTLSALTSTNVVVLNIPTRHDLVKE
jgi:hypothetical protein